jgi:hypothetical protein
MKTVIAIFLILKAISNGIKILQKEIKSAPDLIAHIFVEGVMLILHLWFGIWILENL